MERRSNCKYGTLQDRRDLEPSLQRKIFQNFVTDDLNTHRVLITKYLQYCRLTCAVALLKDHFLWPQAGAKTMAGMPLALDRWPVVI